MADETKSVKCVRDLRSAPPSAYRLPGDGRKWEHVCKERRAVAMHLATYADGDGTSITVGRERLQNELGMARRTATRRLDELQSLGLLSNLKLNGFKGTRQRTLNVAAFLATVGPDSAVGPDTQSGQIGALAATVGPDSGSQSGQIAPTVGPDSAPVGPKPADFGPQPFLTVHPTVHPTGQTGQGRVGWMDGFINQNLEVFGIPPKGVRAGLEELAAKHGEIVVLEALHLFEERPQGFGGLKMSPWALWNSEKSQWLAKPISVANEKKRRQENQVAGGKRLLAEELARVAALNPTPEEQAYVDSEVAKVNAILTSGKKYEDGPELEFWITCQVLAGPHNSLSGHIRTERWQKDESRIAEEERNSIENFLREDAPVKRKPVAGGPADYVGAENVYMVVNGKSIGTVAELRAREKEAKE